MKNNFRSLIRGLFLVLIFILWFLGMPDKWGPLLLLGFLTIPIWGRLYCGYVCPISTAIDIMGVLIPAKGAAPRRLSIAFKPKVVAVSFFVSLFLLITFKKIDFFIPFFIFMIPVGIIATYLFGEECWHRNCFFGTTFSWLGRFSRKGYVIQDSSCGGCGSCVDICPAGCMDMDATQQVHIERKHCLLCGKCREACPQGNIVYK